MKYFSLFQTSQLHSFRRFTTLETQSKRNDVLSCFESNVWAKQLNRCNLMAPFLIPLKSLRQRGEAENHLSIMHVLPLPSEEFGLTRWRLPSWINHPALFIRGDFEILSIFKSQTDFFRGGGYNLFNLRFMQYIISHSLVSNCQYVPLKDSIHCKKIKRKKRKTVQKSWKSNENVHLQSPVNLLSGFWVFNFQSDNSTGVSQITLCQCSFYWKQLVRSTTEARLISLALKLIYWKRGIFDYQL